jgi:hypothetical protein
MPWIRTDNVGQCPGTLIGPQRRDTWTQARFSIPILEEGGRLGLKYLLLSYFRVGDNPPGTRKLRTVPLEEELRF